MRIPVSESSENLDFSVEVLGPARIPSPVKLSKITGDFITNYVEDNERILLEADEKRILERVQANKSIPSIEMAGPRDMIYFDPTKVHTGIVSCGGLSPGINDVIRSVVIELWYYYGVRNICGIRYGYKGFLPEYGYDTIELKPENVADIHNHGGTILGSSRGGADVKTIVDAIERMNIRILFTIGGDGTQRGALEIYEEAKKRGYKLAVVGIPKTIDNDILFVEKTFGFETAFSLAVDAVRAAHIEATGAYNGIGVTKLMGRDSGFIAAYAALANHDVNCVLVPEVPFELEGENGFLNWLLKKRLETRHHAVICVAEGAGQELIASNKVKKDASGNVLHNDIGIYLCDRIKSFLKEKKVDFTLKYIDPSYMVRSAPSVPSDSLFCAQLGQNAVHAAMAGKTGIVVGRWSGRFTHVPIREVVKGRKKIDPDGQLWCNVISATGQPMSMINP